MEVDGGDPDTDNGTTSANHTSVKTDHKGGYGGSEKSKPTVLGKGVMFNITIDVLENGQINVTNGGTLTSETFSILTDVFALKKKHEVATDSAALENSNLDFDRTANDDLALKS